MAWGDWLLVVNLAVMVALLFVVVIRRPVEVREIHHHEPQRVLWTSKPGPEIVIEKSNEISDLLVHALQDTIRANQNRDIQKVVGTR